MSPKGPIAWIAKNHVAANLLMLVLLVGGLVTFTTMKTEVFPSIDQDEVEISVSYSGASPSEVVEGVILVIEDAVSSLEWTDKVISTATEGSGTVVVELVDGTDRQQAYQDIKAEVDRITTFPDEADDPVISLSSRKRSVVDITLYGDMPELDLRYYADTFRQELLNNENITLADYAYSVKDREIRIKISENELRKYNLTLSDVAEKVSAASVDLPVGKLDREQGELVLRMKDKRYYAKDYKNIPIVSGAESGTVFLGDVADIEEGFEDSDIVETFNGQKGLTIRVYRVGKQTPNSISKAVQETVADTELKMPDNVHITVWDDDSELLQSRLDLLMRNAAMGLALVLVILAVFLEFRLAMWVAMGIPISFFGAVLFMPSLGVSINMISSFAFILALGIVVDDAIVVGENIHAHRMMGKSKYQAAVDGTHEVLGAVTFSVLTTVTAFIPLLFIEGPMKLLMSNIPYVVISVLVVSLLESFFILPAHLNSSDKPKKDKKRLSFGVRQKIRNGLEFLIEKVYGGFMHVAMSYRYITITVFVALLIITYGSIKSGHMKFTFMPKVERDVIRIYVTMPEGTNIEKLNKVIQHIDASTKVVDEEMRSKTGFDKSYVDYVITGAVSGSSGRVSVALIPSEDRDISTGKFENLLRKTVGDVQGVESITYSSKGLNFGDNLNVRYAHSSEAVLMAVSDELKAKFATYEGVTDIEDSFDRGKKELLFRVNDLGKKYGLTNEEVGRQVRAAFNGLEALKFQRGLDEVTVRVEYPDNEKTGLDNLLQMYIKTSDGMQVPFYMVAEVQRGQGLASINRTDRKQVVNVSAAADGNANPTEIMRELAATMLPRQVAEHPGLTWKFEGEEERRQESMSGIARFIPVAMLAMYALLAVPFGSYVQPLIVLMAIPCGLAGAVWGHMLMGFNISLMSIFGMVAVAGVVVNDSLVLVDFINKFVDKNHLSIEVIVNAAKRRFRPILMTSLTTFFGLFPMILEKSLHARFLVPMAVSLAFGVLFTTVVALVLVPCVYMVIEDIKKI
ncbi:acriflavin resistance protein [Denitrovibrio acetiphilus DSM 12809]|uniref:Acriflavin resistance protein n=1 Tax=Denitrovibrio acetiphilus (strain DSM 12809 / NBRC 114555 / N2460) TaxID=522772 RepID=D4H5E3_DENA2|nr:efflux RND transporter permease subunit [Denitrovibrio acetiphilus]ADD67563.1 acriflavin resistance protein [Denitrovibrio acetiphilus DSM 12809]